MTQPILEQSLLSLYIKNFLYLSGENKILNKKIAPYIFYKKANTYIFNIEKSSNLLTIAGNFLETLAKENSKFLFVGRYLPITTKLISYALKSNNFYITNKWTGGLLTNWSTNYKQIKKLILLEESKFQETNTNLSKKKIIKNLKQIKKLQDLYPGIKYMTELPEAAIFINNKQADNSLAVSECLKLGIPVISLIDINEDPDLIPYPILINTDSSKSINFILDYLTNKILNGYLIKN